jgi:hypothetical protein
MHVLIVVFCHDHYRPTGVLSQLESLSNNVAGCVIKGGKLADWVITKEMPWLKTCGYKPKQMAR